MTIRSMNINEYSEKELTMLRSFGLSEPFLDAAPPQMAYQEAILKAFVHRIDNEWCGSLRRTYEACFILGHIYRRTPAFEALIYPEHTS